jgi:hypothetical protein
LGETASPTRFLLKTGTVMVGAGGKASYSRDLFIFQEHLVSRVVSSFSKCGMLWHGENWTAQSGVGVD